MIAEYLACAVTSTDETVYRGVHRLPAAHVMHVSCYARRPATVLGH
jgi:hypothetical protein